MGTKKRKKERKKIKERTEEKKTRFDDDGIPLARDNSSLITSDDSLDDSVSATAANTMEI